jgi:Ca2+-binding RTX toxin-like protein
MTDFIGTKHGDSFVGGDGDDNFYLEKGGADTISGGGGFDQVFMGGALTAADRLDGGLDNDTLDLTGDYSAGLVFGSLTMVNFEILHLGAGFSYDLTMNDANVAQNGVLYVSMEGPTHLDASAETNGSYSVAAMAKGCSFVGSQGDDDVYIYQGLKKQDHFDGGGGSDALRIISAGKVSLSGQSAGNFESLSFQGTADTHVILTDGVVRAGQLMSVHDNLSGGGHLYFDGSKETDGAFYINAGQEGSTLIGGQGDDVLAGWNGDDVLQGGAGADYIQGYFGDDTFVFSRISDSRVAAPDTIKDLTDGDTVDLSAIDANTKAAGDQAFKLVAEFTHHAGQAVFAYDAGDTQLSLDVNGDGKADALILFNGDVTSFAGFVL